MRKLVNRQTLLLVFVLLISLAVRVWLLNKRWINPDEGAHLMDAVLTLDGKIPFVDYHSRQPLYIYTIAGIFKLLGTDYISGRLLSLTCSMLISLVIFLIARALYDGTVAILATTIYLMLPLELMNSVLVKTEPLVTLFICLSVYAVILFHQYKQTRWLMAAGILGALGFYVRESALIVPLTIIGFLLLFHRERLSLIVIYAGTFMVGYLTVFMLVLLYYSQFIEAGGLLISKLTPLGILTSSVKKLSLLLGLSSPASSGPITPLANISQSKYSLYSRYLRQAISMHSFLLVGFGFSILSFFRQFFSSTNPRVRGNLSLHSILYLWIFSLFIAYMYYFHSEAFYIDYCREFLPPLVIIFSAWLYYSVPSLDKNRIIERLIIGGLCLATILFFAQPSYNQGLGAGVWASLSITLFCLFNFFNSFRSIKRRITFASILSVTITILLFSRHTLLIKYFTGIAPRMITIAFIVILPLALLEKENRPTLKVYATFLGHSIVLGAFVFSVTFSANTLSLTYDAPWSPLALEEVSSYLRTRTRPTDTVMSGGVIWELQAHRRPFLNISHPLSFEYHIKEEQKRDIRAATKTQPPEVIILDGFTEKTYFRHLPWLFSMLQERYDFAKVAGPGKYPVKLYHLKSRSETLRPENS